MRIQRLGRDEEILPLLPFCDCQIRWLEMGRPACMSPINNMSWNMSGWQAAVRSSADGCCWSLWPFVGEEARQMQLP